MRSLLRNSLHLSLQTLWLFITSTGAAHVRHFINNDSIPFVTQKLTVKREMWRNLWWSTQTFSTIVNRILVQFLAGHFDVWSFPWVNLEDVWHAECLQWSDDITTQALVISVIHHFTTTVSVWLFLQITAQKTDMAPLYAVVQWFTRLLLHNVMCLRFILYPSVWHRLRTRILLHPLPNCETVDLHNNSHNLDFPQDQ